MNLNPTFLDWSIKQQIIKRAQIEATLFCQLFNAVDPENPQEEERLSFTTGPVVPKFTKTKVPRNLSAGMWNFIRQFNP